MKKYTITPPTQVGGIPRSMTKAGAVGFGALLIFFAGLVMLGNRILDLFQKPETK